MELREKLRLALAAAPVPSAGTLSGPTRLRIAPRAPPLFECLRTAEGDAWMAEERFSLNYRHGSLALGDALKIEDIGLERLTDGLDRQALREAAFIDIETTGLSGGAGTVAFLIGVAAFEEDGLRLRQYFLADPSAERAMLASISESLRECTVIVSFNGRCFDIPLLEGRFVLSRLKAPFAAMSHIDLLVAARRLYRSRLSSFRLRDLEEGVLGIHRSWDVSGFEIPGRYFDYLRHGAAQPLAEVADHNRFDVLSLVTLLSDIGRILGSYQPAEPLESLALARWDENRGNLASSVLLYQSALDGGLPEPEHTLAIKRLVGVHRRLGHWQELRVLLRRALDGRMPSPARLVLLVELAKLEEHRLQNFTAAIASAREALGLADALCLREEHVSKANAAREDCHRRLRRLQRRSARRPPGSC